MKQFAVKPEIFMCDTCKEFCDEYKIGKGDLILSNEYIFEPYFSQYVSGATVVYVEKYRTGEPSDEMVEAIYADIKNCYYRRVFAIGGGTIIDVSKLFALEKVSPVLDLYDHKIPAKKGKELFESVKEFNNILKLNNLDIEVLIGNELYYSEDIIESIEKSNKSDKELLESEACEDDSDPFLQDAIETVIETGQASTSFNQRRFKVGYARAGRIIDQMEERGVISGYQGSKPREVLMTLERLNELKMSTKEET